MNFAKQKRETIAGMVRHAKFWPIWLKRVSFRGARRRFAAEERWWIAKWLRAAERKGRK